MSKVIQRFRLTAILLGAFTVLAALAPKAGAQVFNVDYTSTFAMSDVKFLDAQGHPLLGFIGGDMTPGNTGEIYVTNDGGQTFAAAVTPLFNGYITDFTFGADSITGWASIRGNGSDPTMPTNSGLLVTFDGGATWKYVITAPHEINAVYFNKTNRRLFVATAAEGGDYSDDSGVTWKCFSVSGLRPPPNQSVPDSNLLRVPGQTNTFEWTGFANIGDKYIIMCNNGGDCPINYANQLHHWLRSTNGGATWLNEESPAVGSLMYFSSWQPVGIPGTATFFATSDCDGGMYRSDDYGYRWFTIPGWNNPGNGFGVTGAMAGDGCSLFASTNTNGMWESTNDGTTWLPMGPNPISPIRTRFYVAPAKVWAFSPKVLDTVSRPVDTATHIFPGDSINFAGANCGINDTVIHLSACETCSARDTITGSSVTYTATETQQNFSVVGLNSHPFCGNDVITIRYTPSGSTPDTGFVHIQFSKFGVATDTIIRVFGPGIKPKPTYPKQLTARKEGCDCIDTVMEMFNHSCSPFTVTWSPGTGNPGVIQLNDASPVTIPQGSSYLFHIHMCSIQKGTYNLFETFHISATGSPTFDTTFNMTLLVASTPRPEFRGLNWTMLDRCSLHDTVVFIQNTLCDSIIINAPDTGTGSGFYYTLGPGFTLPHTLEPGGILVIHIHPTDTKPGTHSRIFIWHWGVTSLPGQDFDSTFTYSYTIQGPIVIKADATPNPLNFGNVPNCDCNKRMVIYFQNNKCVGMAVTKIALNLPADQSFTIDPGGMQVGDSLVPGQIDSLVVRFCASKSTGQSGSISVTYRNGTDSTTNVVPVRGTAVASVVTTIKSGVMDFGTLNLGCDGPKTLIDSILNGPCSDAHVYTIKMYGASIAGQVAVGPPAAHDKIVSNGSVPVVVTFTPSKPGTVTGIIVIETRDVSENNAGSSDTIRFSAVVVASVHNPVVTAIPNTPMRTCDTLNTCITLTNSGKCDVIHITGATPINGLVTVVSSTPPFPADIAVGATETICLRVIPNGATGTLTGNITLATTPAITVPYSIPLTACGVPTVTLTAPPPAYDTSNCTPRSKTYTISLSQDATDVTVALTGSPRFTYTMKNSANATVTSPYHLIAGDVLSVIVTFQDANATDNAHLKITESKYQAAQSDFDISGTASGAPASARVGLELPGPAMAATLAPNGQSTQEFDFVLRDPVLSSTNVTTLSFQMAWTDEVLTPTGPPTIMGSFTLANPNDYHYNVGQGTADIKLTNTAGAATAAGTQIGKIIMRPSIGKTSTTTVMIQQAKFDSVAEVCHIGAKSAGDIVTITVAPLSCSDTILKNYFNDRPYVDSFSITPNPVRGTTGPGILSFRTLADGELTTDIVDVSGKSVMTLSHDIATRGSFALEIPASRLAEGTYFARVRLAGFTLIRKFIVQKN